MSLLLLLFAFFKVDIPLMTQIIGPDHLRLKPIELGIGFL